MIPMQPEPKRHEADLASSHGYRALAWAIVYVRQPHTALLGAVHALAGTVVVRIPGIRVATAAGIAFLVNGLALVEVGWLSRAAWDLAGPSRAE